MKIGKYPVKHSYKIPRLISDVLALGFAAVIVSASLGFLEEYALLLQRLGENNVKLIVENENSMFVSQQYFVWIFPALAAAVMIGYAAASFASYKLKKYAVTKQNAQSCRDAVVFAASVIKLPTLMIVFDALYIFRQHMFGINESFLSPLSLLCILIIAIIARLTAHRLRLMTTASEAAPKSEEAADGAPVKVKIRPAEKEDNQ